MTEEEFRTGRAQAMTPVENDSPCMLAWAKYKAKPEFTSTMRWACTGGDYTVGSLWSAFRDGWLAAQLTGQVEASLPLKGREKADAFDTHVMKSGLLDGTPLFDAMTAFKEHSDYAEAVEFASLGGQRYIELALYVALAFGFLKGTGKLWLETRDDKTPPEKSNPATARGDGKIVELMAWLGWNRHAALAVVEAFNRRNEPDEWRGKVRVTHPYKGEDETQD